MNQALLYHYPPQHFHYTSADVFADSPDGTYAITKGLRSREREKLDAGVLRVVGRGLKPKVHEESGIAGSADCGG